MDTRSRNLKKKHKVDRKYAIEAEFSENVTQDISSMVMRIANYVSKAIPKEEIMTAVSISDYTLSEKIVMKPSEYTGSKLLPIDITWGQLEAEIEGFTEFFNKYPFERSITQICSPTVPIHRHKFSEETQWSVTVMLDSGSGKLRFYESKTTDDAALWPVDPDECICVDQVTLENNKIYTLSTWNWHSWKSDNEDLKPYITIFCLKGSKTYEDAKAIINCKALTS